MNTTSLLAPLALAGLLGLVPQQEATPEKTLTRVPHLTEFADDWATGLRSLDLDERRRAHAQVLEGAARSPAVREVVEGWLTSDDLELAWTAELLLREIDATARARPDARQRPGTGWDPFGRSGFGLGRPDDLFGQLDQLFDDPFGGSLFRPGMPPGAHGMPPGHSWSTSTSQGLTLDVGPDGVRVEVREMEDGEEKVRTYEAESMEALIEAHPELEERLGDAGSGWSLRLDDDAMPGFRGLLRQPFTGRGVPPISMRPSEVRTDVLGVRVRTAGPTAGLDEGVGLEVVLVMPDSLASLLGMQAGEVLVEVGGREIRSADDVKRALAERPEEDAVEVEVLRPGGHRVTLRWEPPASGPVF